MELLKVIRKNRLIKSSFIYSFGIMLIRGINIITFPIFSRMLTVSDFGVITIYTTWIGFISVLIGMQINSCIPTARIEFNSENYKKLLETLVSFVTIIFCIVIFITLNIKSSLANIIGISESFIVLMVIQSFFSVIIGIYTTHIIQKKEDKKYLKISLITTLVNIFLSLFLVIIMKENKYVGKILGGVIATVIFGGIFLFKIIKGKFIIDLKCLKFALKMSIPIIPHVLSHQLLSRVGVLMLNNSYGNEVVGIYNFALNIGTIIQMIWTGVNSAWVPWLFDNMKENQNIKIKKASKIYITVFTAMTILVILFIPEITIILAPKEYMVGISVVPLIVISYYFVYLYSFPVNLQFYNKNTVYIPIGTIIAAIINIISSKILVSNLGMIGAAISMLLSYIVLFIFHLFVTRRITNKADLNIRYYINGIVSVIIFSTLFYFVMNWTLIRYFIISISILLTIINRRRIVELLS